MTDENDAQWPPALFASQLQEATETAAEQQLDLFRTLLSAGGRSDAGDISALGSMSVRTAVFKTRVQSGGRISIPDAEREALDIDDGDLVQTIVIPLQEDTE